MAASACVPSATGAKLSIACARFGIALNLEHRALTDARATVELMRKCAASGRPDARAATVGQVSGIPNPRTLRREARGEGVSDLVRIVSHAYYPYSDEVLLQYLDALDRTLDDRRIDGAEYAELVSLANRLRISPEQRTEAHRAYVASIIAAARRDDIVTEAERQLIKHVADALKVPDVVMPEVTDLPAASSLQQGMRVCFTGTMTVSREPIARSALERLAACAGLQPVRSVTRKGCDVLVAADVSTWSGKARKAHSYGIPVISVAGFLEQVGAVTAAQGSPP